MIPQSLQGVLWSKRVRNLDLEKDEQYVINQILAYGGLEDIKWAKEHYGWEKLKRVFVEKPLKVYLPRTFHFVKKILFDLSDNVTPREKYDQTLPRLAR
ncbi:hypothetical protein A3H89_01005 [Candidatus Amesbacteria bacterium RIFCSPLOWO2_02_FULL_48_11]|uniref:DUF6922 domain-containing protein n=4 Tax=Candidatus Amesiibacteriota TaxID=1752730 RepID=A0A1F4ZB40_9BACT|nr:MAG: hypothetical protein UY22_C0025G0005 [Candidatus Amesbacteria bacterium GW2011_GWC1_48_10]KKU99044.1 MAG: hypothetical protein UY33_C0038G0003 [Candidatus Amesbacteria bacterium GW2011_GWA1_48_9]OGC89328.1 MAG: hypothetical protein A2V48_04590 [Candidatus Amesbacteria bacterium RBG_19FT_COMBO_48_16]OGC95792.1 MAG: hypothetical protein A3C34_03625 [Candidatus Amesbacteria bacterium RIFCSPHIGHO2_02_FULL_48_21]OGC98751.1 MAG: hypothetical protein A2W16_01880 [Candidatus Amesbacteria bacter